jgi:hypothetical protein
MGITRRQFVGLIVLGTASKALPLPTPASRPLPDTMADRMSRTLADLRAAGFEVAHTSVETRRVAGSFRPPVGYCYAHRCGLHIAAFAGPVLQRKLRCLICETAELHPDWVRYPFLLLKDFKRVVLAGCSCPMELIPFFGHKITCRLRGLGGERVGAATLMTLAMREE